MRKVNPIKFDYKRAKAWQAAAYLLYKHGASLDILKLIKLVFLADWGHILKYGRPIVGGKYVAMQFGPVASSLYNDLKTGSKMFARQGHNVILKGQPDEEELSESDLEVLSEVDQKYGSWDTFRLAEFLHKLKVWKNNYPCPTENTSRPIPYEDFFLDVKKRGMLKLIRDDEEAWGPLL